MTESVYNHEMKETGSLILEEEEMKKTQSQVEILSKK